MLLFGQRIRLAVAFLVVAALSVLGGAWLGARSVSNLPFEVSPAAGHAPAPTPNDKQSSAEKKSPLARWFSKPRLRVDPATVENRLMQSVRYLASDELEGRGVGTRGLDLAADYIALEFKQSGLDTTLVDNSPFQVLSGSAARYLTVTGTGETPRRDPPSLKNVVAAWPGNGDFGDETIVIGAHYDHLGYGGGWGSLAPWTNEVHNGADDNASGTAVMIEVARQFAARDERLRRRLLFIGFTAEESGLVGSEYFMRHPIEPISNYAAMINLDMVGYLRGELEISGTATAGEFEPLLRALGSRYDTRLTFDPSGYGPSDHASFHAHGIPVLHFFTGFHDNYHRPGDDAEKLNVAGMRQITELTVALVERLANAEQRPTPSNDELASLGLTATPSVAPPPRRASGLGIQTDPAYQGDGVRVARVAIRSAADRAGIRPGDVILKINDTAIADADEFQTATKTQSRRKPLTVQVKRALFVMELELGGRS